jgi:hypothetical protein
MARYIDANELYKKIFPLDVVDKRRYSINAKAVAEAIVGMPTADVAPRAGWISVEERLPDDCGMPVLMVAVNSYNQMRVVKGFTDYQCPITFHTNEREYDGVWRAWEVTHWMPLPEPPVMKGGAE